MKYTLTMTAFGETKTFESDDHEMLECDIEATFEAAAEEGSDFQLVAFTDEMGADVISQELKDYIS